MSEIAVRQTGGALAFPDESEMGHVMKVVRAISRTEFVPKGLRGNEAAILACVLTGRSLGLDPMHALRAIHIVDGKPSLEAQLMVSLVRKQRHSVVGNFNPDSVTVTGKRGDNGDTMSVTWTTEMAQRAGLVNKDNWKKYPEAMLWARAVSQLCRMLFADVLFGVSYTPEELGGEDVALPEPEFGVEDEPPSDLPAALQSDTDDEHLRERAPLVQELLQLAARLGDGKLEQKTREVQSSLRTRTPAEDLAWLRGQLVKARGLVDALPEAGA